MPPSLPSEPSFSSGRRWLLRLNLVMAIAAVLALLVMLNYLAAGHFKRFPVSSYGAPALSIQTERILKWLTNDVEVTIFFDTRGEPDLYSLTSSLLDEYKTVAPTHLHIKTLDYTRFDGEAKTLLAVHHMTALKDKNFVLFESGGNTRIFYAKDLASYDMAKALTGQSRNIPRNAFRGEMLFTAAIFAVSSPQTFKAYFLQGHGEHDPNDTEGRGYSKLAGILTNELDTSWERLSLQGTNVVPANCGLLIIAGPTGGFLPQETAKIEAYLKNGRALLLASSAPSGVEDILDKWGVGIDKASVRETNSQFVINESDGSDFRPAKLAPHPTLNPINNENSTSIRFQSPRPFVMTPSPKTPGAPEIKRLAATSSEATILITVEQGEIKGGSVGRGGTRILASGDSLMFDDNVIDGPNANHVFAGLALNWLLDRPTLMLEGLGPRPIKEYNLAMTTAQTHTVEWLFLAGIPGAILAIGGLVSLRRRS